MNSKVDLWIEQHSEDMIKDLQKLVSFKSVSHAELAQPGAPFGAECKKALEHILGICHDFGFADTDMDGYIGYADYGTGDETLGVLMHLDVVPEGEGWSSDPFAANIIDGTMIGRGVLDDKGPAITAVYALAAIKAAGLPFKRKVRLLFGCDEEVGMGMVFTQGGTTGGSDIIVKLLRIRFRYLKTGIIFAITDTVIVACSALVFKNIENGLYAGISLAVQTIVFDLVLYGPDEAKSLLIISDEAKTVARRLMDELDVGVTYLNGIGAYSNSEKLVILCAMRKQLFPKARTIVKEVDPGAFMIVSSANEIFGEGFKDHFGEEI